MSWFYYCGALLQAYMAEICVHNENYFGAFIFGTLSIGTFTYWNCAFGKDNV